MAQGNKSRIVIWVIVGILVVVAVVLLLTRPKSAEGPKLDPVKASAQIEGRLGRLERSVGKENLAPDAAQKIADEVGKARAVLAELAGMTDASQAQVKEKIDAANVNYKEAKRLFREATGKDTPDEPEGK